ncbi:hypothetical protein DFH09DRAFT_1085763 [Mycena vulgaris]|nr:hypothetical protein DFH09DRAFT_1085763 [Mycena vulgaris]
MPTPELSAHASRNLTKPVQPPRRRQPQSNATKASRADAFQKRAKKMSDLNVRFKEIFAEREEQIVTLAAEFDQTEKYVRHVLENSANYTKKRATNLKNAITFELSRVAREEGDASNLLDVDLKGDAYQAYKNSLSEEQKAELIQQLDDHKECKERGVRATNKSGAMDAMQTANRSGRVLGDLESRTGVCSVALFSRGSNADAAVPCWVDSNNTHLFFEQVLGIGIHDVLAKMEMWCCNRKKVKAANDLAAVRTQITQEVEAGLAKILNLKDVRMSWTYYRLDIIHEYGVELAGWPTDKKTDKQLPIVRPSKLPAEMARLVLGKLKSGALHWVALTKSQRAAIAKEIEGQREAGTLKTRAERVDKGKTRGPRSKKAAAGNDSNSDEEDDGDEEEEEEEDPAPAPAPSHPRPRPRPRTSAAASAPVVPVAAASNAGAPTRPLTSTPASAPIPPTTAAPVDAAPGDAAPINVAPVVNTGPIPAGVVEYDFDPGFDYANMEVGMPALPSGWGEEPGVADEGWRLNTTNAEGGGFTGGGAMTCEELDALDARFERYGLNALDARFGVNNEGFNAPPHHQGFDAPLHNQRFDAPAHHQHFDVPADHRHHFDASTQETPSSFLLPAGFTPRFDAQHTPRVDDGPNTVAPSMASFVSVFSVATNMEGAGGKRKRKAPVGGSKKATGERDEDDGGESKHKKVKTAKTKPKQVAPPPPAHASHA